MSLPMERNVTKEMLDVSCDISLRGRCRNKGDDVDHPYLRMRLHINASQMPKGMSDQQKKVGITAVQEMFTDALEFLGHEVKLGLQPGMVVRVVVPGASDKDPVYVGVVEKIGGDRIGLRTFNENAEEQIIEVSRSHYDIVQDPKYMGIEGLKQLVRSGHLLPFELRCARDVLNKSGADEHVVGGRETAAIVSIDGDEEFEEQQAPVERVWGYLVAEAALSDATAIHMALGSDEISIYAHRECIPYAGVRDCTSRDLYDHVKRLAGMDLEMKTVQRGGFSTLFRKRRISFMAETSYHDPSRVERLVITLG